MARVNSLIRRYTTLNPVTGNEAATMLLKDMVIDKINRTVTVQNLPVDLTGKEFDLLLIFGVQQGSGLYSKNNFIRRCGQKNMILTTITSWHLSVNCAKKIEPNPEQPFYIQTVRGCRVSL